MPRLKGKIIKDLGLAVVFQAGSKTAKIPKSLIKRLEPNNYCLREHTIWIGRWLLERKFGCGPARMIKVRPETPREAEERD